MPINSRRKGGDGERELIRKLADELGTPLVRNLDQSRDGGSDILGLGGWAIEVKRSRSAQAITPWWEQTVRQAVARDERPVLAYRFDRRSWRFRLAMADVIDAFSGQPKDLPAWTVEVGLLAFCAIVRETESKRLRDG